MIHKSPPKNQSTLKEQRNWCAAIVAAHKLVAHLHPVLGSYEADVNAIAGYPELDQAVTAAVTEHRKAMLQRDERLAALKAELMLWAPRHQKAEPTYDTRNLKALGINPQAIMTAAAELIELCEGQAYSEALRNVLQPLLDAAEAAVADTVGKAEARAQAHDARRAVGRTIEELRAPYRAALMHLLGKRHALVRALRRNHGPSSDAKTEASASAVNLVPPVDESNVEEVESTNADADAA